MDENSMYLNLFFEETEKYLSALNYDILLLEKQPEDTDIIDSIFRSAHTLKGMAATMGMTTMIELTHQMENVFQMLKNEELKVSHELISLIFACLDTLTDIVVDLQSGGSGVLEIPTLLNDLIQIANSGENHTAEEAKDSSNNKGSLIPQLTTWDSSDLKVIEEGKIQGYHAYVISIRLDEETTMKSARAFLVMNKLETAGDLILTEPSIEELEDGDFEGDINMLYLSKESKPVVKDLVLEINEIDDVVVANAADILVETDAETNPVEESEEVVAAEKSSGTRNNQVQQRQTIRVDLNRLDQFMNLVSELVIHRSRLESVTSEFNIPEVVEPLEQVERITSELQDVVLQLRMQPFNVAVQRFPRMIRDLADELGKDLKLEIQGEDTELDRAVVTELGEPLVHLLRNAADHGIEAPKDREALGKNPQGTIKVGAFPQGNRVVVTVSDDGKGIDPQVIKESAESKGISTIGMTETEMIQLIFHPGFSTKKKVTGVSGRGVGLDVVKEKIMSLNGTIEIISEIGNGSTFRIVLPLTLSIIQSLLVKAGDQTFALPQTVIEKIELYEEDSIKIAHNSKVYPYEGEFIPVVYLSESLDIQKISTTSPYVVIVNERDQFYAVVVDALLEQREIVIKELGAELADMKEYLGATILGNGEVVLILDLSTICTLERGNVYESNR